VNAFEGGDEAKQRVAEAFFERQANNPVALNAVAWGYATKADVTETELMIAERAALLAVGREATNATLIDTLAAVYYRERRFDGATTEQRRAVQIEDRGGLVAHMGLFLAARFVESGPYTLGSIAPDSIEARLEWPYLVLDVNADVEQGLDIYALDERDGHLVGTARVLLGPGVTRGRHKLEFDAHSRPLRDNRLIVAYLDSSGCSCPPGSIRLRYIPSGVEATRLPAPLQKFAVVH